MTREEAIHVVKTTKNYPELREALSVLVPELHDSEDERVRKSLIEHLKACRNQTNCEVIIHEYAKWIAWLEKQKEQEPKKFPFLLGDAVPYDEGYNEGYEDAMKEQKPTKHLAVRDDFDLDGNLKQKSIKLSDKKEQVHSIESVLVRAGIKPYKDGNQWCILMGYNIQEGICGFGDTIDEAFYEFLMEIQRILSRIPTSVKTEISYDTGR